MRLVKWPVSGDRAAETITVLYPEILDAEAWLLDVEGSYYIVPRTVIINLREQFEQIKKAEPSKTMFPSPRLCLTQAVYVNPMVAKILLEEQAFSDHQKNADH
jgi:hypothetical protein